MKTIWKYELSPKTTIELPVGAILLTVKEQYGNPTLWALVDTNAPKGSIKIVAYETGESLPDNPGTYIDTIVMDGGDFVFHFFEVD